MKYFITGINFCIILVFNFVQKLAYDLHDKIQVVSRSKSFLQVKTMFKTIIMINTIKDSFGELGHNKIFFVHVFEILLTMFLTKFPGFGCFEIKVQVWVYP